MPHTPREQLDLDLHEVPGHLIRRLQQIAVAIFLDEVESLGLTPVQFAALHAVAAAPGIDQRTLAAQIGLDTSTVAGVIDRLEARGLLERAVSAADRRARVMMLTTAGLQVRDTAIPAIRRAQDRILAPLTPTQRRDFVRMLKRLVNANNELSRAPAEV